MQLSPNFSFLKVDNLQLVRLGTLAERNLADDPNTCSYKLRRFGEVLARQVAAKEGFNLSKYQKQFELLKNLEKKLKEKNLLDKSYVRHLNLFHILRMIGNDAAHNSTSTYITSLAHLHYAYELGIWYYQKFCNRHFKAPAFIVPQSSNTPPIDEESEKIKQLDKIIKELEQLNSTKNSLVEQERAEQLTIETKLKDCDRYGQTREINCQNSLNKIDLELIAIELAIDDLQGFDFEPLIRKKLTDLSNKKKLLKLKQVEIEKEIKLLKSEGELLSRELQNCHNKYAEKLARIDKQIREQKTNARQLLKQLDSCGKMLPSDLIFSIDKHKINLSVNVI